jgi:protein transport protein SEC61 subunit alpha
VHLLITRKDKVRALREALFRSHQPNLWGVVTTLVVFFAVILFENIKIDVGLEYEGTRQKADPFEIRLFYCSTTPIILQSYAVSGITTVAGFVAQRWPEGFMSRLLGVWSSEREGGNPHPIGGLAYYLQAPGSIKHALKDPIHAVIYLVISLAVAGAVGYYYSNSENLRAEDVAEQLHASKRKLTGHRYDKGETTRRLKKKIPITAAVGGVLAAFLCFCADFLGAFGTGTGIIVAVSIIWRFVEDLSKELQKSGMKIPGLGTK